MIHFLYIFCIFVIMFDTLELSQLKFPLFFLDSILILLFLFLLLFL